MEKNLLTGDSNALYSKRGGMAVVQCQRLISRLKRRLCPPKQAKVLHPDDSTLLSRRGGCQIPTRKPQAYSPKTPSVS